MGFSSYNTECPVLALTHLQHPGSHYSPHVRGYFSLDAFEVVRSGLVLVFCPQHSMQDPFSQQVWVPVGPPDGRPVPLTAQQLRFHLTYLPLPLTRCSLCFSYFFRVTVEPNLKISFDLANNRVFARSTCCRQKRFPTFFLLVEDTTCSYHLEMKTCVSKIILVCLRCVSWLLYSFSVVLWVTFFCCTAQI